jgi:hypothetical protein
VSLKLPKRASIAGAVLLLAAALAGGAPATASFLGGDGDLAFVADCGNGQQVWSVSSSSTGNTCSAYKAQTAGATDAMPYFSDGGATLYFASNRNGPWTIYSVPYSNAANVTASGDGATALTNPGAVTGAQDYAPTVSADGTLMSFIRCTSSCHLYTQAPLATSTPNLQNTPVALLAPPNTNTGDADRPEFNPVNDNLMLYVGSDNHIHLWNIGMQTDTDLSSLTGVGTFADEHPDWSPDGAAILFDSSRTSGNNGQSMTGQSGNTVYVMTGVFTSNPASTTNPTVSTSPVPTVAPRWLALSAPAYAGAQQIEPVYAPNTSPSSDGNPMVAWVSVKSGSNIDVLAGMSVNAPTIVDAITATRSVNSMVDWQPTPLPVCSLTGSSCTDAQNFQVTVNPGTITLTTPYTPTNPFVLPAMTLSGDGTYLQSSAAFPASTNPASQQIVITSLLAPAYAWTLSVSATNLTSTAGTINSSGLGLTNGALLDPAPGPGTYTGTITFTNLPAHNPSPTDTDTNTGLSSTPRTWAHSTAADGTAELEGTLTLFAPTSTPAGTYTGTITFGVS